MHRCAKNRSGAVAGVLLGLIICLTSSRSWAQQSTVPADLIDSIKSLKTLTSPSSDAAARAAVYDLLAQKGDARLIPAVKAYKDGLLLLRDGRLMIYGDRVQRGPDSLLPLLDAITLSPILDPAGAPIEIPKLDLSGAIRSPPRGEKPTITDLISTLALLDPNPEAHLQSIRDAGERAAKAMVDQATQQRVADAFHRCRDALASRPDAADAVAALDAAIAEKKKTLTSAVPDSPALAAVKTALEKQPDATTNQVIVDALNSLNDFQDYLDTQQDALVELPKFSAALHRQLNNSNDRKITAALREATAEMDSVLGDRSTQLAAMATLGSIGTERADNLLHKLSDASAAFGDSDFDTAAKSAQSSADHRQTMIHVLQNTFSGLSLGSILVLLALGLSIIFGLMGVINMAQGEFMMVGAFATFVVSQWFASHMPTHYDLYPIVAVPVSFLVAGLVGYICEILVVRRLYGRPLETLLATWGISLILIQIARVQFGDNASVKSPSWMEGGFEVLPDLVLPLNRVFIIVYCALCISAVYLLVNRTRLGLLLRATTQNREMASALGVRTRRVDAFTFAFGAGLAGLAGVVVPLYNKINPGVGQEYIVDCFMVVVVGGVGKLAGAIIAGFGLGFINKYLEPILSSFSSLGSGAAVYAKVIVLGCIVLFLQYRPSGLFPPKGRSADA